eukprot:CAMPEP_0198293740 /NCGR_PEP_ID=MMETSP1449-20131203/18720_1 /TAXON_ID=420275 /ORGANISM="Attheya septentrionalis, Strain CCMP2084" /LENGTH=995 /DNA_ID=CAMNT_0043993451 /DNA_START=40 /DNA_END=3027 /DNA_ORIENTATION=-
MSGGEEESNRLLLSSSVRQIGGRELPSTYEEHDDRFISDEDAMMRQSIQAQERSQSVHMAAMEAAHIAYSLDQTSYHDGETSKQTSEHDDQTTPRRQRQQYYGSTNLRSTKTNESPLPSHKSTTSERRSKTKTTSSLKQVLHQSTAVILVGMLNIMSAVPFGVSYFPISWKGDGDTDTDDVGAGGGQFPLPGKEALGIRMFLFSTIIGQVVFAFSSKFENAIGLQMVENVPFCHSLANIVIAQQGYGIEALSTLFFLFGLSSVLVGLVFYVLGRLELGSIVYFFPSHVLVGCIGGIGVFIMITGIEVTTNEAFTFSVNGLESLRDNWNSLAWVIFFEATLRLLMYLVHRGGKGHVPLLSPIYFCLITPLFYLGMFLMGSMHQDDAESARYFFPSPAGESSSSSFSIWNKELFNIWTMVDFSTISWTAVYNSIPTIIALTLFSLIHVPINIPAFAISTNTEPDMNAELIAHGYANGLSGLFGGLQNYMAYSYSVLYSKSGGTGRVSSLAVAAITSILFVVGPSIAKFIPRCMAGTLLAHIGIDLMVEGVYESYGNFDYIEYSGIWLITIVMSTYGMEAALVAGVAAALSTYVVQSITYQNPIRSIRSAKTLRSSARNRLLAAAKILDDDYVGRGRILLIQLQGHLFFGNITQLTNNIKDVLSKRQGTAHEAWIVILDFTLVLGIDSSAAQSLAKLKGTMHKKYSIDISIYVTGSSKGFPTQYELSRDLSRSTLIIPEKAVTFAEEETEEESESVHLLRVPQRTRSLSENPESAKRMLDSITFRMPLTKFQSFPTDHVTESLDSALTFAEDVLIARQSPELLNDEMEWNTLANLAAHGDSRLYSVSDEEELAFKYLSNLCSGEDTDEVMQLLSLFEREVYKNHDVLWRRGAESDCLKLLIRGSLVALLEDETGTREDIIPGAVLGELGLVTDCVRLSTVECISEEAVLFSLSKRAWEELAKTNPKVARFIDMIVIRYLSHRVQHVSNRIFETRCLPI